MANNPAMLTERELEEVTVVFKSFETGMREATIHPKVYPPMLGYDKKSKLCMNCECFPGHSLTNRSITLDQGWSYRIEKLSNADMLDFSVYRRVYSYRTSHIEYLDILKTSDFFVFFRRKYRKFPENTENP